MSLICQNCSVEHPGYVGSALEKNLFRVKKLDQSYKVFFCDPICYLATIGNLGFVNVEDYLGWYKTPEKRDIARRRFLYLQEQQEKE